MPSFKWYNASHNQQGRTPTKRLSQQRGQLQHGEHSRPNHPTPARKGGQGGSEGTRTWGLPLGLQNPPKAPKSDSLPAAGPLPTEQQQLGAAAVVAAAFAIAGAAEPAADAVAEKV